ncbi:MAG: relaxase/mobilization nuclease domain-containing protein [Oscillospiraceae bacterium]
MAVTSIWSVKGWLGKVVLYAENPDKTTNPKYYEKQMTDFEAQNLNDVIEYAVDAGKTGSIKLDDENEIVLQSFVSGVNCLPETARDEMLAVKKQYGKNEGVMAYHGYQSFAPGEATPELAHKIGVSLAKKLWGNEFQVVVATHLDKLNHLHNHFVLNTVSFLNGRRYYRSEKDYFNMRAESDRLCLENGLSVIQAPKGRKAKHYAEWSADRKEQPTVRGMIKDDIDRAIAQSSTEKQFYDALRKMGYQIKQGKDVTLIPQGKERGVKLFRNFGDNYSREAICNQILSHKPVNPALLKAAQTVKACRFSGKYKASKKLTGFRALYFAYMYKLGVLPQKRQSTKQVYFLYREDLIKLKSLSKQAKLLMENHIDTDAQLLAYKADLVQRRKNAGAQRMMLKTELQENGEEAIGCELKEKIAELTKDISNAIKEVKLCNEIYERSAEQIRAKLLMEKKEHKKLKTKEKEIPQNGLFGRFN